MDNRGKKCRKTKLVPREINESDEEIFALQSEVENTLAKIKRTFKTAFPAICQSSPSNPTPESNSTRSDDFIPVQNVMGMDFDIKVEVENIEERIDIKKNLEIQCNEIITESANIAHNSDNIFDKILHIQVLNSLKPEPKAFDKSYQDRLLDKALMRWRDWSSITEEPKDSPLCYKCYICELAWWHLSHFRDHIQTHNIKNLRITLEMNDYVECTIVAFVNKSSKKFINIDGKCWKCGETAIKHTTPKHCSGCNKRFYTCIKLRQHEWYCGAFKKKYLELFDKAQMIFKCHLCRFYFFSVNDNEEHMILAHSVRSDVPIAGYSVCEHCKGLIAYEDDHICETEEYTETCSACMKHLTSISAAMHRIVRTSPLTCPELTCQVKLSQQCMLPHHSLCHTTNYCEAYKCLSCNFFIIIDPERKKEHQMTYHARSDFDFDHVYVPKNIMDQLRKTETVKENSHNNRLRKYKKTADKNVIIMNKEIENKKMDEDDDVVIIDTVPDVVVVPSDDVQTDVPCLIANIKSEPLDEIENRDTIHCTQSKQRNTTAVTTKSPKNNVGDVSKANGVGSKSVLDGRNNETSNGTEKKEKDEYEKELNVAVNSILGIPPATKNSININLNHLICEKTTHEGRFLILNPNTLDMYNIKKNTIPEERSPTHYKPKQITERVTDEGKFLTLKKESTKSKKIKKKKSNKMNYKQALLNIKKSMDMTYKEMELINKTSTRNIVKEKKDDDAEQTMPIAFVQAKTEQEKQTVQDVNEMKPSTLSRATKNPQKQFGDNKKSNICLREPEFICVRGNEFNLPKEYKNKKLSETNVPQNNCKVDGITNSMLGCNTETKDLQQSSVVMEENRQTDKQTNTQTERECATNSEHVEDIEIEVPLEHVIIKQESDPEMDLKLSDFKKLYHIEVNLSEKAVDVKQEINEFDVLDQREDWAVMNESSASNLQSPTDDEYENDLVIVSPINDCNDMDDDDYDNDARCKMRYDYSNMKGGKLYKCIRCNFQGYHRAYRQHKVRECPRTIRISKYYCLKCQKYFESIQAYLLHFEQHNLPKFTCPQCSEPSKSLTRMTSHVKWHINSSFVSYRAMQETVKASAFRCRICHLDVTRPYFLKHWDSHLDLGKVLESLEAEETNSTPTNNLCKDPEITNALQLFSNPEKLMDVNRRNFRLCILCSRRFNRRNDCKRHLIEHFLKNAYSHKSRHQGLKCQICGEVFIKADLFRSHMRLHACLPVYKCELCDRTFSDSSNFSKHKKVHNFQVLICDICKKKFHYKRFLISHLEEHEKIPPISCELCNKIFYARSMYKKHYKNIHAKQNITYKCYECDTDFTSLKHKWDHMWEVHNERIHQADCMICNAKFRKKTDLKRHYVKAHGINDCSYMSLDHEVVIVKTEPSSDSKKVSYQTTIISRG